MCESAKVIKCPMEKKGLKCMKGQIPPSTISRLKENLKRHEGLRRPEITKFSLTKKWEFSETNYQSLRFGNFFCKNRSKLPILREGFKSFRYTIGVTNWGEELLMDIVFHARVSHEKCYGRSLLFNSK